MFYRRFVLLNIILRIKMSIWKKEKVRVAWSSCSSRASTLTTHPRAYLKLCIFPNAFIESNSLSRQFGGCRKFYLNAKIGELEWKKIPVLGNFFSAEYDFVNKKHDFSFIELIKIEFQSNGVPWGPNSYLIWQFFFKQWNPLN